MEKMKQLDIAEALMQTDLGDFSFSCRSTLMDGTRAANIFSLFLRSLQLPGDVAECGVYAADTSSEMIRFIEAANLDKTVHLFDTFSGFPDVMTDEERKFSGPMQPEWWDLSPGALACPLDVVKGTLAGYTQYQIHQGKFSVQFPAFHKPLCFIYADADLYQSTVEIIRLADRLLVPSGIILFDDYGDGRFPGVTQATKECLDMGVYRFFASEGTNQAYAQKRVSGGNDNPAGEGDA